MIYTADKIARVRRKRTKDDKQFSLWITQSMWRRLHSKAGTSDTTVTELINRWLEDRLDAEGIADPTPTRRAPDEENG